MEKTIRLKIKKELSSRKEKMILHLKGLLISKSYTDIIQIGDENEEFYTNYFTVLPEKKDEVIGYINTILKDNSLEGAVAIY